MKRWGKWSEATCPCYGEVEERFTRHLWTCRSEALSKYWVSEYSLFLSWLVKIDTSPSIVNVFMRMLGCETHGWSARESKLADSAGTVAYINMI